MAESRRLVLKDTQIVQLAQYPGEDGDTQVLAVRALLSRPLAQELGCHDNCFAENGMPRHFVDLSPKGLVIENCEVDLDGEVLLASRVQSFKVGRPSTQSETDASLEVKCNLHFAYAPFLSDWAHRKNKGQFETAMTPPPTWNAQPSLFDQADPDVREEADPAPPSPLTELIERVTESITPEMQSQADRMVKDLAAEHDQEPIGAHLHGEVLERHNAITGASNTPALASARDAGVTLGTAIKRHRGRPAAVVEINVTPDPPDSQSEVGLVN
jgi:hypothetical protein